MFKGYVLLSLEYIWPDGEAQGCPFEMHKMDLMNKKSIDYLIYSKDGSVFGYGSKFSLIPELKLSKLENIKNIIFFFGITDNLMYMDIMDTKYRYG